MGRLKTSTQTTTSPQMLSRITPSATRIPSFISAVELMVHPKAGKCISIDVNDGDKSTRLNVPLVWFRDNCSRTRGTDHTTNHRAFSVAKIAKSARISDRSGLTFDGAHLSIDWDDGGKSVFDSKRLLQLLIKPDQHSPRTLWKGWELQSIPTLERSSFSFAEFARNFVRFGIVAVHGIEGTVEETKRFASELAPLQQTFYGDIWTIKNESLGTDGYLVDQEFTNGEVPPHTDFSYHLQTPGVMLFHCLHPATVGGETLFFDAFAAAERLKSEHPSAFRILTETPIDYEYRMAGSNPLSARVRGKPVIELNADGDYAQIRFNPEKRAPLRLSSLNGGRGMANPNDVTAFYDAYEAFSLICNDTTEALKVLLKPGTVIFFDNFRLLHARTAFSGYRLMCGCYLSRDELMANARLHLDESIQHRV